MNAFEQFLQTYPDYARTYSLDQLRDAEYARLDARGQVYLDFTGGGLYAASQVRDHAQMLCEEVLGNPHSLNPSSMETTRRVEQARQAVLRHFNARGDYTAIFTLNASGALKLVGEAYPFTPGGTLLLTADNHNSVNGMREFARAKGAEVHYAPLTRPDLRLDAPAMTAWLAGRSGSQPVSYTHLDVYKRQATTLAERGHEVHLFDGASAIGGQFNMAKRIPGKEEFEETLRYFARRIAVTGVKLQLGSRVGAAQLQGMAFDQVILATGVLPRDPRIPGQDHPKVLSYIDVLLHRKPVGTRVAVVGAGGIGFDVAEYLAHGTDLGHPSTTTDLAAWLREWGVVDPEVQRGGVTRAQWEPPARQVTLLQRKPGKHGAGLGKTTGWIHRAALKMKQVEMLAGVNYERIGDEGLFVTFGKDHRDGTVLAVDTIVLCAGQEPLRELHAPLLAAGVKVHLIGGAFEAGELDAKRAIDQGTRLAASL